MYCEIKDVRVRVSEVDFGDEFSDDIVTSAILGANSLIDGYIAAYLPLSPVPSVIKELCIKISIYNLFLRANQAATPEIIIKDYESAISLLKMMAKGEVKLTKAQAQSSFEFAVSTKQKMDVGGYG